MARILYVKTDGWELVQSSRSSPVDHPILVSKDSDESQEKELNLVKQNNVYNLEAAILSTLPLPSAREADSDTNQIGSDIFYCAKCPAKAKGYKSLNQLLVHYVTKHFWKTIQTFMSANGDNWSCKICRKSMHRQKLALHVGLKHEIIHHLLDREGILLQPSSSAVACDSISTPSSTVANPIPSSKTSRSLTVASSSRAEDLQSPPSVHAEAPVNQRRLEENAVTSDASDDGRCNFSLTCEVCQKKFKTGHGLQQHYVRHFHDEVDEETNRYHIEFVSFLLFIVNI